MRLWLRDSERLPDPPPMKTDDRAAIGTGLVLWLIAAVISIVFSRQLNASASGWILATAIVGVALGVIGLVYAQVMHVRLGRSRLERR
ncbi:MAG TPA: DUF2530 domain-containing protein [Humibacter sp.]|uniref:DUF2530 domain-containing protein n=1 Tax=Humibacter sp. RRB41 TaxID=2919946 RepID=UPI0027E281D2|nr:DUF2530 domain-containing protein [Humibacter sp. RRB41]HWD61610.1 DUF2530 domain-containing protein [Humibacter sp.]